MRSYSIAEAVTVSPHLPIRTGCHDPGDENVPKRQPSLKSEIADGDACRHPTLAAIEGTDLKNLEFDYRQADNRSSLCAGSGGNTSVPRLKTERVVKCDPKFAAVVLLSVAPYSLHRIPDKYGDRAP